MTQDRNPIEIGFGEQDITPRPPAEDPEAFRVFDPVAFRAIVIRQGARNVTLLSGDFFSFENSLLRLAAEQLSDIDWLEPAHLLPSVSHCGGAPILWQSYIHQPCQYLRTFGQEARFAEAAAAAVRAAVADLRPARIGFGKAPAPGLLYNRRSFKDDGGLVMSNAMLPYPRPELRYGPVDANVYVMRVDEPGDVPQPTPRAAAIIFGCHALCNNDKLGHVSSDYPHYAREVVRRAWEVPVAFMPGALGNVVPVDRNGRAYQRVGNGVGGTALYALEQTATTAELTLSVQQRTLLVPTHVGKSLADAETALAGARAGADGDLRFGVLTARRRAEGVEAIPYTMTLVRLGDTALMHLPGEVFVETAAAIREHSGADPTIVISGPTADVGYLCPPEAHAEGGMEPRYTGVAGEAETLIRRAAIDLLRS